MSPKPRDLSRRHSARRTLHVGLLVGVVMGACALAIAGVPHTFNDGDTLEAAHLNANFTALDQRIAALEAKDPFSGTYPAVFGLGTGYDDPTPGADRGGTWFCGSAPATLEIFSLPDTNRITFSHAFGSILFTNAGRVALNLDFPWIEHAITSICGPEHAVCSAPLTFFLKSPKAQTLRIQSVLDNAGAIYVDGKLKVADLGAFPNRGTEIPDIPQGPFALSFMACSKGTDTTTGNITLAFDIYDAFLTDPAYGLTVDYDRTFHRNGQ